MIYSVNPTDSVYAGGMKTAAGGGTAASNKAALQAALNSNRCVAIPYGSYPIEPGLNFTTNGQTVFGQGPRQTILNQQGSGDLFISNKHTTSIRDFQVNGDPSATWGFVFYTNGTAGIVSGGYNSNILVSGAYNGFYVEGVNNITFDRVVMQAMRGDVGIHGYSNSVSKRTDIITINDCVYNSSVATRNIRGIGLYIDGFVHSVIVRTYRCVAPNRGVLVNNTPNMPWGQAPSFIFIDGLEVDYPYLDGVNITICDRFRLLNSYVHGSVTETGIVLGSNVKDATLDTFNSTSHAKTGLYVEGQYVDIKSGRFDWNSQAAYGVHQGILLGPNSNYVNIIGGSARDTAAAYGICRSGGAPEPSLSCTNYHNGVSGNKNW